jgi:hypothetical protein
MSAAGMLTTEVISKALLKEYPKLIEENKKLGITLEQGANAIKTGFLVAIGEFNEGAKVTQYFGEMMADLAQNMFKAAQGAREFGKDINDWFSANAGTINTVVDAFKLLATVIASKYVASMLVAGAISLKTAYNMNIAALGATAIVAVILILHKLGISFGTMANYVGKAFGFVYAWVVNTLKGLYNYIINFAEFFANVWFDPIDAIQRLFLTMADICLGALAAIAKGVDKIFKTDFASTINNWKSEVAGMAKDLAKNQKYTFERTDYIDFEETMDKFGKIAEDFVNGEGLGEFGPNIDPNAPDGTAAKPINTKVGNDIKISDEDIKLMKDVAQQRYVNQYTTLRPEMTVHIDKVEKEADVDVIAGKIADLFEADMESSLAT